MERKPGLTPQSLWKQPGAGPHDLPPTPPHDDTTVVIDDCFSLAEVGLVSPHLGLSSMCLPGRSLWTDILQECTLPAMSTFLLFAVLWGTAGNVGSTVADRAVFQGACFPASGSC